MAPGTYIFRAFEETNLGQIMTVFPGAYHLRQEKGLPSFTKKVSGYQLTIEANLEGDIGISVQGNQGKRITST